MLPRVQKIAASLKSGLVLSFLLVLASTGTVTAQSAGFFTATGSMTSPRSFHTATLLQDGTVLIAGGTVPALGSSGSTLASAELFDPSTGIFTATGDMTSARHGHTATLLPNGQVLIVGGYGGGNDALASAELFDPATGTFASAGTLITARGGHTAILLSGGKVLIVGGYGTTSYPNLASAELYDPATGTSSTTGAYLSNGGCDFCPPAVLLADGTVLFTGQDQAQVYDPAAGVFSLTGAMSPCLSTATLLTDGRVLFAGGECIGRLASAVLYGPTTGAFPSTGNMTIPRAWHTATLLPDGTALIVGGETDACAGNSCMFAGSVASAEIYDPSTGAFVATGSMSAAREVHTATLLNDGTVLIAGGESYGGIGIFFGATATAEIYTPSMPESLPSMVSRSVRAGPLRH
jgi:hypothetical protein